MSSSPPDGWHTLTPRIFTPDAEGLVGFLRLVFAAEGEYRPELPAEMKIGDSIVMVSGTEYRDPMPACLYVYVDDVDATFQRALAAGATSLEEPCDMPYGDRRAMISDAWSNVWQLAARNASP